MKKTTFLFAIAFLCSNLIFAQEEMGGILGKLGLGKAKPDATYPFKISMTYKTDVLDKKGKSFSMTSKMYFSTNEEGAIGLKIIDGSDPKMKSAKNAMEFMVIDPQKSTIYSFMNNNGKKNVVGISMKSDKFSEKVKQDEQKKSYQNRANQKDYGLHLRRLFGRVF